jgi:Type IV pili methyl-accepting chemotaxis transducer N-term
MDRRLFIKASVPLVLSPLATAQAQGLGLAINRTARCRMLSQRAAKAYGLVAFGLNSEQTKPVLVRSIKEMRDTITEIDGYTRGRNFANSRAEFSAKVLPFLSELSSEPSTGKFRAISLQSDKILDSANSMVLVLETLTSSPASKLINMAGRQRMLTQRMAKNYLLREAKTEGESTRTIMEADKNLFLETQKLLAVSAISTPAIKESLEKSASLFNGYLEALSKIANQEPIARASEIILAELENQTSLFEKALASVLG